MMAILRRLPVPVPPVYTEGAGLEYATTLAERGQTLSFTFLVLGWICVVSGGLFALMGTTARTDFQVEIEGGTAKDQSEATGTQPTQRPSNGTPPFQVLRLRSGTKNWFYAHIGLIFGTCAIVFAGVGWSLLDRSSAASLLATAATHAIGRASTSKGDDADLRAYKMCIEAKTSWLEGRMNHDQISQITSSFFGDSTRLGGQK